MKHKILTICCAAIFLFSCNSETKDAKTTEIDSTTKTVSDEKKDKEWVPIDSAMMEKAWKESMTLGEPHKMLAKSAGKWKADLTMWMSPDAPPMKSTGTSVNTMLYGGLYQQSKHSGTMMGAPFEGTGITGYDNAKKEYFSTWIDNMGSGILISTGQWDDATKSLTMTGTMKNPANGMDCTVRQVMKMPDDNTEIFEMYGPDPKTGKEYKTMEIKYTRSK